MEELVFLKNDEIVCSSLQVAERFHKRHDKVLRSIDELVRGLPKNGETQNMFILSNYTEPQNGQVYRMFYMNRDGFSLLAMGFTGKEALEWKVKYIQAFNKMEHQLKEHQSSHWQQTRLDSKSNRRMETDEINQFIQYAKEHGSRNAEKYYIALSKLADNAVGIQPHNRDAATASQLNNLILVEHIIGEVIQIGMQQGLYYKNIYKACKARIEQFREIVFFTQNKNALI